MNHDGKLTFRTIQHKIKNFMKNRTVPGVHTITSKCTGMVSTIIVVGNKEMIIKTLSSWYKDPTLGLTAKKHLIKKIQYINAKSNNDKIYSVKIKPVAYPLYVHN